jgi:hypothetical protein
MIERVQAVSIDDDIVGAFQEMTERLEHSRVQTQQTVRGEQLLSKER